jgi:hypothetical protein
MEGQPRRLLTFTSGGWVLLLALLITAGLVAWAVAPAVLKLGARPPGDGRNVESYAFDLSDLAVPRHLLVPAMHHRDMAPVVDRPSLLAGADMEAINQSRGKFVLPYDRVVGVEIGGEARAYPISVLNVHEVIHDELGGVPIAVTYHWPCDSPVVLDRRVGGRVIEFGVSGLLYNSNMVLYERRPSGGSGGGDRATIGGEALWSQMLARAISGPAARRGEELAVVPCVLTAWRLWLEEHPATTVADRDETLVKRRYSKGNPDEYFQRGVIIYPVDPRPDPAGPPPLTRVLAVEAGGARMVYPLPLLAERADASGVWRDTLGGIALTFEYCEPARTARVRAEGGTAPRLAHAVWFAWHAMHPEDALRD